MIGLGKKHSDIEELNALLHGGAYNMRIRLRLLDLDHNYKKDLTDYFYDGQVTVDNTAEVTRALDLTLMDPRKQVHIDPDSPSRTSVFISDMISVVFVVQRPDRSKEWDIPVFCGPIDSLDRDEVFVDIKCLGKESLSITNLWRGKTYKPHQPKTDVIKQILRNLVGETKLSIPDKKAKLPDERKLSKASKPWKIAKAIAKTMGFQLFYDGRGFAVMRRISHKPVLKMDEGWIITDPKVAYDLSKTINAVRVIGKKPKKQKEPVQFTLVAPKSHPLSPWRIGRGGVPRYLWTEVQDESLRTTKECKDLCKSLLADGLLAGVDVTYDGVVHPGLQEGDVIALRTDLVAVNYKASKFTIPLTAATAASYGYHKRIRPKGGAKRIRPRHKHHHRHHQKEHAS
jgi:hypothetical protein